MPANPTEVNANFVVPKREKIVSSKFQVTDDQGRPIEAAKLTNTGNPSGRKREATTDATGIALIEDILTQGADEAAKVSITAPGFITISVKVPDNRTMDMPPINVTLRKGKVFVGRVVTPDGKPAAGVRVYSNSLVEEFGDRRRTQTNEAGEFSFDGIDRSISIDVEAWPKFRSISNKLIAVPADSSVVPTITLEHPGSIRVRAVDDTTGEELKTYNVKIGFSKKLEGDPPGDGIRTELMQQGVNITGGTTEYRLDGQTIGSAYSIIVSAEGYSTERLPRVLCSKSDEAPITEVRMKKLGDMNLLTVTGVLRDENGPVANARVRFISTSTQDVSVAWSSLLNVHNNSECIQFHETTSNERGEFQLDNVQRNANYNEIYYTHATLAPQRFPNLQLQESGKTSHFELTAAPTATVVFRVNLENYPEANSFQLRALGEFPDEDKHPIAFSYKSLPISKFVDGALEIPHVPSGEYEVSLQGEPKDVDLSTSGSGAPPFVVKTTEPQLRRKITIDATQPRVDIEL